MTAPVRIGLISDTHGLLRAQVHEVFAGVDRILHAGDVCGDEILDELALIAPVQAVFGNCDVPGDPRLAESLQLTVGGVRIHVRHGHELGRPRPAQVAAAYDADVCVYGHTHRQMIERVGDRLVVNPGAAGPRRFDLEPSVAILTIADGRADATLVPLTP
ncbi:MAG: metallophosphoesterase family protein [Gemmatimonadota bacterium]